MRVMREEWDAKVKALAEQIDMVLNSKVDGEQKPVIDPGLKVRHKKSRIRYTVQSASPRDLILKTPEGTTFLVDKGEAEREYELD